MTRVNIEVPDDLHTDAVRASSIEDVALKDFVIRAIRSESQSVLEENDSKPLYTED